MTYAITEAEKHLLTLDYRGREYKRTVLKRLIAELVEECARIAECEYPASTPEERTYGRFIAATIRAEVGDRLRVKGLA